MVVAESVGVPAEGLPIAVIVYRPAATPLTVNEMGVIVPAEMEQPGGVIVPTMLPINMQFVSLSEKPEPDTVTTVPDRPDGGIGEVIVML